MGSVYQACDRKNDNLVAIKTLDRLFPANLIRFKREFRSLANVHHPNLVSMHELFEDDERWFFSMELLHGQDFHSYVRTSPKPVTQDKAKDTVITAIDVRSAVVQPATRHLIDTKATAKLTTPRAKLIANYSFDEERLRKALAALAVALDHLHQLGHVHRDIKPSNVLVTKDERVVLLDFGIAAALRPRSDNIDDILISGTPGYMAPEQLEPDNPPTPAMDWYAFGSMLYEALVGSRPFNGDIDSILANKQLFDPPSPEQLSPEIPADLSNLCLQLLHRNPEMRPNGQAIRDALTSHPKKRSLGAIITTSLVGREAELEILDDAFERSETTSQLVLVGARSGLGKTALVQTALDRFQEQAPCVVLEGRCYQQESLPYKTLDSLVDRLAEYLSTLEDDVVDELLPDRADSLGQAFPVLKQVEFIHLAVDSSTAGGTSDEARAHAMSALRELVWAIAKRSRLVMFVDDLQWGDLDSAPFMTELLRSPSVPLLLIGTYRTEAVDSTPALDRLLDEASRVDRVRSIELSALRRESATRLARDLLEEENASTDFAEEIAREGQGDPYLIRELVRFASQHGTARIADLTLRAALISRAEALPESSKKVLELIAVCGRALLEPQLLELSAQNSIDEELRILRAGQFVRSRGEKHALQWDTYHDKVRETVLETMPEALRNQIHARLVPVFARDPKLLYPAAQHAFQGREYLPWQEVFELNRRAAQTAFDAFAYEEAYGFIQQCSVAQRTDANFEELAGDIASAAARGSEAADHYMKALEGTSDVMQRARIRLGMAAVYQSQLDMRGCHEQCEAALRDIDYRVNKRGPIALISAYRRYRDARQRLKDGIPSGETDPVKRERSRLACRAYSTLCLAAYFQMDRFALLANLMRSFSPAVDLGSSRELLRCYIGSAVVASIIGKSEMAQDFRDRATDLAEGFKDPVALGTVAAWHATSLNFEGRPVQSERDMVRALESYEDWLETSDYLTFIADLVWNLLLRGYAQKAANWYERGLRRTSRGQKRSLVTAGHTVRCYAGPVYAELGQADKGKSNLEAYRTGTELSLNDRWRFARYNVDLALYHMLCGETGRPFDDAVAAFSELKLSARAIPDKCQHIWIAMAYTYLERARRSADGERKQHLKAAEKAVSLMTKHSSHPSIQGHGFAAAGQLAVLRSRDPSKSLQQAEELASQNDNPWVLFEVAMARAQWALAQGHDSASYIEEAIQRATAQGWQRRLERAHKLGR